MADSVVTTFTANTSALEASLQELLDKIGALENKTNASAQSIEKLESAGQRGGAGVKNVANEAEGLAGHLENVATHTDAVSNLLGSLGVNAEAGASKLGGLSSALSGLAGMSPMLLGVGAAVTAVFAAFEIGSEAVKSAGEWQQKMAILGQTVRNQGGDWKSLSQDVQEWADLQERTTTFSRDQAVEALTKLTATGMSLGDAMKVTRVAEDAAAATGKNLNDVENGLMEAMHGRTQALTALGLGTKQSIHDGMKFNDVLALIEKSMGGAAAQAANTFPGALTQLSNSWTSLMQDVGTPFLNLLTGLVKGIVNFVEGLQEKLQDGEKAGKAFYEHNKQFIDDLGKVWGVLVGIVRLNLDAIIGELHAAWDILAGAFTFIGDLLTGHWNRLWDDVKSTAGAVWNDLTGAFGNFGDDLVAIAEQIGIRIKQVFSNLWSAIADAAHGNFAKAKIELSFVGTDLTTGFSGLKPILGNDALAHATSATHKKSDKNPADTNTNVHSTVGGPSGSKGQHGAHGTGAAFKQAAVDVHTLAAAHNALAAALGVTNTAEKTLTTTVDKSTTSASEKAAKLKALNDAAYTASQQIRQLVPEIGSESDALRQSRQDAENKREALNKLSTELGHTTKLTKAQKDELHNAQTAYQHATQKVKEQTAELAKHEAMLGKDTKAVQASVDAQNALWKAYNDSTQANIEKNQEEHDTYGKSLADQIAYYQNRLANQRAAGTLTIDEQAKLENKIRDLQEQAYQKSIDAQKQAQAQQQQLLTTFFDDILSKHMSFKDAFKNVWDDIVKIFIADIEKMMVESQLFKSIFGNLGVGGGFNPLGAITGMLGGGSASSTVSMAGVANTADLVNMVGTPGSVASSALHVNIAGISPNVSSGASSAGMASIMLPLAIGAGAFGVGDTIGKLISGGGPGNTHGTFGGLGALAGVAGAGLLAGTAGITLGGSIIGFGGGLGGGLAALAASGPVGWGILAGGAILGGLAGGLFGHKDNPANMPDKYDTQNYGTIIADLMGSAGANGQHFTEQSSLSHASGGKTGISWVEQTLAQYANPDGSMGSNAPDWLKPMWSQLVGAFGISASGSGQLQFGHAINNEWVTGAQGVTANGNNPMQYTQLGNLLNQFYTAQQQGAQNPNSNIPIFSLKRMAPDFNQGSFVAWSATTGTSGASSTRGFGGEVTGNNVKPEVHIHLDNGVVVGSGGMNELADLVQQKLTQNRFYNYNNRYTEDY